MSNKMLIKQNLNAIINHEEIVSYMDYLRSYQHGRLHQSLTVKTPLVCVNKKNLVFYVFIEPGHVYEMGHRQTGLKLTCMIKMDRILQNPAILHGFHDFE